MNSVKEAPTSLASNPATRCWLCDSADCTLAAAGIAPQELSPAHFAITDAHYGTTLPIYACRQCGFRFCPDAGDVTGYYQQLEDTEYERTREQRAVQARHLLKTIQRRKAGGTLLDIGAGSGIAVEQALALGYQATGIEPGIWLAEQARKRSLPVVEGVFPEAAQRASYDIITLVDVLEHVREPLRLLEDIRARLAPGGIAVIVTSGSDFLG